MSGSFALHPPSVSDMIEPIPSGWKEIEVGKVITSNHTVTDSRAWESSTLRIIVTIEDLGNAGYWMHTSTSGSAKGRGKRRQPTWDELAMVKEIIHGDRLVVQILPPRSHYVQIAECLHLWERIDGQPTIPEKVWRIR